MASVRGTWDRSWYGRRRPAGLAAKEVRESQYWLAVVQRSELLPGAASTLRSLTNEASELTAILCASAATAAAQR